MKTFQQFVTEAGATSTRLADVVRQRMDSRRDFSVLPQGQPSLNVLQNLQRNAEARSANIYLQHSSLRRGSGGAGVLPRGLDPVRISPSESGRITSREITRRMFEKDANRNVPLTRREVPIPIRSKPIIQTRTGPRSPLNPSTPPLTPAIRDQRAAAAGFSGEGSIPKGPKLYRQIARGIAQHYDPFEVIKSASTQPKPLPKPRGTRGGSSSLSNVGRGVQQRPSGTGFTPGTGGNFGISGIGLAN